MTFRHQLAGARKSHASDRHGIAYAQGLTHGLFQTPGPRRRGTAHQCRAPPWRGGVEPPPLSAQRSANLHRGQEACLNLRIGSRQGLDGQY